MKNKDELIDWLRDAYAMEKAMELSLKKQLENESAPMELREQASIHYVETQGHAEAVAGCLKRLGSDPSTVKTICAEGLEIMKGLSTAMARDERVKDALAAYTAEHFEIACYTALRTAAQRLEEPVIVTTCDAILLEEMKMAA